MSNTVDTLVRILDEERQRAQRAEQDHQHIRSQFSLERVRTSNLRTDYDAALKKIDEWAAYGIKLHAMLKQRKVLDEKLPPAPAPLETEIPF
jgi:predicted  nucleic acid-binding Zn-ribbon protein